MIKKLLTAGAVIFALLGAYSFAKAADRTDCIASIAAVIELNQKDEHTKNYKILDLPDTVLKATIDKYGPPPVAEPYTLSIAVAKYDGEDSGMAIIHDGDCILTGVGPYPLERLLMFLGITEANYRG